jgi:hypothetical protein
LHTLEIETQALFLTPGNGIEETNALDKPAIASISTVTHRDVVEGSLLGTTPG